MQLQRAALLRNPRGAAALSFKDPETTSELVLTSQASLDAEAARTATLPPLQSVLDLTTATQAPQRHADGDAGAGGAAALDLRGESAAGHALEDGSGTLPDGSTWQRESGEERGDNGYWCRWWVLRGTALGGRVEWEETWWEASDWSGMREMGAQKAGCNVSGDAWREAWKERVYHDAATGTPHVERNAHKWARDAATAEEWEEKWGEWYAATGAINKWAEKWGRRGSDVWHEKWGEDYAAGGDSCVKWTDRWSEALRPDGSQASAQGEKWREDFGAGTGQKTGEAWYQGGDGHRYQRWWGENHHGGGWVQKYGHSTEGERWDVTEQSGTYYNPKPHFNFHMALDHSPDLLRIPVRPREETPEEFLSGGLEDF